MLSCSAVISATMIAWSETSAAWPAPMMAAALRICSGLSSYSMPSGNITFT